MVLDRALVAAGDEDHVGDAGGRRLLDRVLDQRLVDDRQHLLRARLGRRQEARAEAGDRKHRLGDLVCMAFSALCSSFEQLLLRRAPRRPARAPCRACCRPRRRRPRSRSSSTPSPRPCRPPLRSAPWPRRATARQRAGQHEGLARAAARAAPRCGALSVQCTPAARSCSTTSRLCGSAKNCARSTRATHRADVAALLQQLVSRRPSMQRVERRRSAAPGPAPSLSPTWRMPSA